MELIKKQRVFEVKCKSYEELRNDMRKIGESPKIKMRNANKFWKVMPES